MIVETTELKILLTQPSAR